MLDVIANHWVVMSRYGCRYVIYFVTQNLKKVYVAWLTWLRIRHYHCGHQEREISGENTARITCQRSTRDSRLHGLLGSRMIFTPGWIVNILELYTNIQTLDTGITHRCTHTLGIHTYMHTCTYTHATHTHIFLDGSVALC